MTSVLIVAMILGSGASAANAQAVTWELRRQTMGAICHVQRSDSAPKLGDL